MKSRFLKKWQQTISSFIRNEFGEAEEFLDSSASSTLKDNCLSFFSPAEIDEFNDYQLVEELGRGSMGIVYKAMHKQSKQIYALKILPARVINDPLISKSFFQEICVQRTLNHKNIIRFHKVGLCPDTVFIIMEYVLGNDLGTLLSSQKRLSPRWALEYLIPILEGLQHAYKLNVVHRDIKPANIIVHEATKQPKIADFGLAQFTSESCNDNYAFGTPAYMAPEQIMGKKIDIRADIYATGSILYHMLAGERPYAEIRDPVVLLQTKIKEPPRSIRNKIPQLEDDFIDMLKRSLSRFPQNRFSTPLEFLQAAQKTLEKMRQSPAQHKKILKPSEQLIEDSRYKKTAFMPPSENLVFMTASRPEVEDLLTTHQREMEAFVKSSAIGAVLHQEEELEDSEFEDTLLTMSMAPKAALQISSALAKKIKASKGKNLLDRIAKLLEIVQMDYDERCVLNELRYLLLLRGNTLTKPSQLITFINEGSKSLNSKLDEMSRITQMANFNKKIRQYYFDMVVVLLKNYDEAFRSQILACRNADEINCYMQNYPLTTDEMIKRYKNLRIIKKVKQVMEKVATKPDHLESILNDYFGMTERKLSKAFLTLFLKKGEKDTLWAAIARSKDLPTLVKHLERLKVKSEFRSLATKLFRLIEVFIDSGGRTSLENFKTSLNFMPQGTRNRVCHLVKQQLNHELSAKIQELLASNQKKLNPILALLRNPRYDSKGIALYGYSPKILAAKISELKQQKSTAQQIFSANPVPLELIALVSENNELEIAARAKTLENCLKELRQLQGVRQTNLLKVLLKIFHSYGKVNLAANTRANFIDGYQLSRDIVRFYNTPNRKEILLPHYLHPEITVIVKDLVNRERTTRLQKLKNKKQR